MFEVHAEKENTHHLGRVCLLDSCERMSCPSSPSSMRSSQQTSQIHTWNKCWTTKHSVVFNILFLISVLWSSVKKYTYTSWLMDVYYCFIRSLWTPVDRWKNEGCNWATLTTLLMYLRTYVPCGRKDIPLESESLGHMTYKLSQNECNQK